MIVHVLKRAEMAKSLTAVYVATDSQEICDVVSAYGGKAILTGKHHMTGTDRIAEAAKKIDADIVVNVQGDEALLDFKHIDSAVEALHAHPEVNVALLVTPFSERGVTSVIKAVLNEKSEVLYFSREDIPSGSRTPNPPMKKVCHLVPFRKNFLFEYAAWPKGELETIEFNEYLRILEKGHKIKAVSVENAEISIDTPADLEYARKKMSVDPLLPSYAARKQPSC